MPQLRLPQLPRPRLPLLRLPPSPLLRPLRLVLDVQSGMVSAAFWASWDPQQGVGISVCGEDVTALDTAAIVPVWEQPEPKAEPEEDEESEQPQPRQEGEQENERVD